MTVKRRSEIEANTPVWIMEVSRDEGKTWTLVQSFGMYVTQDRAVKRAARETVWHRENLTPVAYQYGWRFRAREYRPSL